MRILDGVLVAIARDEPHRHLVALPDRLAAELEIRQRGASQVQHRRVPADDLGHQARHQFGFSRSSRYSSGNFDNPHTPPDIEFRVVSLPPTISRLQFASNSRKSMFRVASACAIMEITSNRGALLAARSSNSAFIAVAIFCNSA